MSGIAPRRSTRRQSMTPRAMGAELPRKVSKPKDEVFVSSQNFDFKSPKGVMTRARRSSIYVNPAPAAAAAAAGATSKSRMARTPRKAPVLAPVVEAKKVEPLKATKGRKIPAKPARKIQKSTKTDQCSPQHTVIKDLEVVIKRLGDTPAKKLVKNKSVVMEKLVKLQNSPKRVELVSDMLLDEAMSTVEEENETKVTPEEVKKRRAPAPVSSKRRTRSSRSSRQPSQKKGKNRFSPALKEKMKKVEPMKSTLFFNGTPQGANPMALLKDNLKNKVKEQMEERVSNFPSSPYALQDGQTENGSPAYMFTKLNEKPKSAKAAVKYMTATPGIAPGGKARRLLGSIENNIKKAESDGNKRLLRSKLDFSEMEDEENMPENDLNNVVNENSPLKRLQPQLVTGDLVRACCIM